MMLSLLQDPTVLLTAAASAAVIGAGVCASRPARLRNKQLRAYRETVAHSLHTAQVCDAYCSQVGALLPAVNSVRICTEDTAGYFVVSGSTGFLETGMTLFSPENAIVHWLRAHRQLLAVSEICRTNAYHAMWESEKAQLNTLQADYLLPIHAEDELTAIVLLSTKEHAALSKDALRQLHKLTEPTGAALKNSRLYEITTRNAQTDELTGLLNRKYFLEQLEDAFLADPTGPISLMLLDLDNFTQYNQLYGRRAGNDALRRVADVLRSTIGEGNFAARLEGNTFGVLMPGKETSAACRLAENLRRQIYDLNRAPHIIDALRLLTVSIGVCCIPFSACSVQQILSNAEAALIQMKQRGKNGVNVASVGITTQPLPVPHTNPAEIYGRYANIISAWNAAINAKDRYAYTHAKNVAYYASALGQAYGLDEDTVELLREAALLHDIGKLSLPEKLLNRGGTLTAKEQEKLKRHPEEAASIIRHLPGLDAVLPAVICHHEQWDGKGYPHRLSGEDIPLNARILCIADCFDTLTACRSGQDALDLPDALNKLRANAGTQFDPDLVNLFVECVLGDTILLQTRTTPLSAVVI